MEEKDENQKSIPLKIMTKKMSNYFSLGIDARIGLGSLYQIFCLRISLINHYIY